MTWPMEKLGVVAPAKPIKTPKIADSNSVWLLNLDMVESHTGRVIDKLLCSPDEAGTSTHWFDENYVLYSKLRPYLNKVVVPDGLGLATTELVPMLPDPKRLDRKYLAYYLRSENFVRWVNEQVAGAKMPRVSMKIFWEHEMPLPSLEEQKRIAAILDKADAIRQKRQQALALADDFLRSVFLDMFGDPVTNPKGWKTKELQQIADFVGGSTLPDTEKFNGQKNGIAAFKVGDMNSDGNGMFLNIPREWASTYSKKHAYAPVGTIVIPKRGGAIGTNKKRITSIESVLDPNLMGIIPKDNISIEYLFYWFEMFDLNSISNGSSVPQLNKKDLAPLKILIADAETHANFKEIYSFFLKSKNKLNQSLELSVESYTSLCKKAFSGQL